MDIIIWCTSIIVYVLIMLFSIYIDEHKLNSIFWNILNVFIKAICLSGIILILLWAIILFGD